MKTNKSPIKGFKAVEFMREVRDKISMDIKDMNFEEIKMYMEERRKNANPYSDAIQTSVVSEPVDVTYITANEKPIPQEPIKSISAAKSAKLSSDRLSEKYAGKLSADTADSLQQHVKR